LADMTDSLALGCPHCGETFSIAFDVSEGSAEFIVDCEVCCAPMTVTVAVNADGEIEALDVTEA
jgi:transcription elongation factor Elf1